MDGEVDGWIGGRIDDRQVGNCGEGVNGRPPEEWQIPKIAAER